MISIQLNSVFKSSVEYAKEHKHEYLTLEHIFLSILNSNEGREIFQTLDIDVAMLREEIADHIIENTPTLKESIDPMETISLSNAIGTMMAHIRSSGRCSL